MYGHNISCVGVVVFEDTNFVKRVCPLMFEALYWLEISLHNILTYKHTHTHTHKVTHTHVGADAHACAAVLLLLWRSITFKWSNVYTIHTIICIKYSIHAFMYSYKYTHISMYCMYG